MLTSDSRGDQSSGFQPYTTARSHQTHLKPSDRLDVTLSPRIDVSTLSRDTMSPADRSANSGSCFNVARYAWFLLVRTIRSTEAVLRTGLER